jgi:hypothetical protein
MGCAIEPVPGRCVREAANVGAMFTSHASVKMPRRSAVDAVRGEAQSHNLREAIPPRAGHHDLAQPAGMAATGRMLIA